MLRRARWLLLLAILAISAFVGNLFLSRREALEKQRPQTAAALPPNTLASSDMWEHEFTRGNKAKVRVRARHFEQIKEPSTFLLEGMEMYLYEEKGNKYDLVKSSKAIFDIEAGTLYSEGEVDITMRIPEEGEPGGRLLKIRSSGVTFDSKTNKVSTDKPASFEFDRGSGHSVGAFYDPNTKELQMKSEVVVEWRNAAGGPPMQVEASQLLYREAHSDMILSPPARLRRDKFYLEADQSFVFLNKGQLDRLETTHARGKDELPQRTLEYSADFLKVLFAPKGEVQKIEASDNARLTSASPAGNTVVTARRFDLDFDPGPDGSTLRKTLAMGGSRVESRPVVKPGTAPPPARVLTSETIELTMRDGGKEIERVETHAPGQVDFLPQRPGDKRRHMEGERLYIEYGAANAVRTVRAVTVTTRTEGQDKRGKPSIANTNSKDLLAHFDEKSGEMTQLEQWGDFSYEEGTRKATADKAVFDAPSEVITLTGKTRVWDETGLTAADEIVMDQNSGDMTAAGNVSSSRAPDKKAEAGGMLSSSEPLQAKAAKMTTSDRNRKIRYEGNAFLWQASSSLRADSVLIDKANQQLEAHGNVVSQLPDQRQTGRTTVSVVRAPSLVYSDKEKTALYTGGVTLSRPKLELKSRELRAWFVNAPKAGGGDETKLDRIFADGAADIVQQSVDRRVTMNGEHAEYYPGEERMVLTGGNPVVVDSKRGTTRGAVITWFARDDRLLVDNSGAGPAVSRVNRERKK